ncbi:putative MRPL31-mitochondrial ribosomal protein, large subunit [Paraphysoderma sedebokerense]|nr:putative MRPL31-mitochondrial ribosomal protein, large subunit [Paraphysoderma sedebokerense]
MFGPFRASFVSLGGRLNKIPWRLSDTRKANVRKRIKAVDSVLESVVESGVQCQALTSAISMPKHSEMRSVNKYFVFARNHTGLKKGVHKVPKFTKTPLPRAFPAGIKRKYI